MMSDHHVIKWCHICWRKLRFRVMRGGCAPLSFYDVSPSSCRHTCISFHCQLNVLSVQQLSTSQIIQKKKKNVFEKKFCHFFASSFDFFSLLIRLYQCWWQFVWVVVAIIQENGDLMASNNESETPYSWSTRQRMPWGMRSNAFSCSSAPMLEAIVWWVGITCSASCMLSLHSTIT